MGSVAMDQAGDIGLGYSASGSAIHPAIRYTGRTPSDATGTMETDEEAVAVKLRHRARTPNIPKGSELAGSCNKCRVGVRARRAEQFPSRSCLLRSVVSSQFQDV